MSAQRLSTIAAVLTTAGLFLPAGAAFAGGTYHSPFATPASSVSADNTRTTRYYIPTGAPVNRSYTWYAPPAGYQVIMQGTPAAPREVELTGPGGTSRSFRLEGPVVMRTPYQYVRTGPQGK
jgi:hypothetical protein